MYMVDMQKIGLETIPKGIDGASQLRVAQFSWNQITHVDVRLLSQQLQALSLSFGSTTSSSPVLSLIHEDLSHMAFFNYQTSVSS